MRVRARGVRMMVSERSLRSRKSCPRKERGSGGCGRIILMDWAGVSGDKGDNERGGDISFCEFMRSYRVNENCLQEKAQFC